MTYECDWQLFVRGATFATHAMFLSSEMYACRYWKGKVRFAVNWSSQISVKVGRKEYTFESTSAIQTSPKKCSIKTYTHKSRSMIGCAIFLKKCPYEKKIDLECKDCNVGMVFVQSFSAYLNSCKDGTWIREKVKHFCFFLDKRRWGTGLHSNFGPKTQFSAFFQSFF